eukprot:CAMPEP_0116558954 /NCGR_PEP_ID=MMETSP0397-20121206/10112_1 /TAXON_ID=216820 /ORGANISM="Cyclophora tenuis, Strain ECT3854" /LENGTH=129 /DNA_ID=CAMNT_0004084639 /DNA_START=140 /DNA_END=529 /DNA_ORIENTATION=-
MVFTSLSELSDTEKKEFVASLAAVVVGGAVGEEGEVSADKIEAVVKASGNTLPPAYASLWAGVVNSAKEGINQFCAGPGSGGGGGGGGGDGGGAAAEEEKEEEKEEEEEEMDLGGGMDMFGGEEGGGDY